MGSRPRRGGRECGCLLSFTNAPNNADLLALNKGNLFAIIFFSVLVFGILALSGNLTDGPRIVDDNQIFRLQTEFSKMGFLKTLSNELTHRTWSYKRFVPVYLSHKVIGARLLGRSLFAWSIYSGLIGVFTAYFLFLFGKQLGFSFGEPFLLALLTLYGEQSILWWRLLHGEGIGMFLLAISLIFMAMGVYSKNKQSLYTTLFLISAIMASLSKESFILILPALGFWRLWLFHESESLPLIRSLKRNAHILVILAATCIGELLLIKYYIGTTTFSYAGWEGFDPTQFVKAAGQFFYVANPWLPASVLAFGTLPLVFWRSRKRPPGNTGALIRCIIAAFLLFVLMVLPQILLYQKTGFLTLDELHAHIHFERYFLPGMLAYAALTVSIMSITRKHWKILSPDPSHRIYSSLVKAQKMIQPLLVVGMLATLAARTPTVYAQATSYSHYNQELDKWFRSIVDNTNEKDTIVIVHHNSGNLKIPLRVKFILNELYNQHNLYFYPLPDPPSTYGLWVQERSSGVFSDLLFHSESLQGLESIPDPKTVKVVAIIRSERPLEAFLKDQPNNWMDLGQYERYSNKLGFVTFYKKSTKP